MPLQIRAPSTSSASFHIDCTTVPVHDPAAALIGAIDLTGGPGRVTATLALVRAFITVGGPPGPVRLRPDPRRRPDEPHA